MGLTNGATVTVVVGNPRSNSRTRALGDLVVTRLTGAAPDAVIELADLGPELLDWSSESVASAKKTVAASGLVVVASPTYKGSYTGLLKLFIDRFAADELVGGVGIPVMLGGDLRHLLAVETALKPILTEIGLACPTRGLFAVDSAYDDPDVLDAWVKVAKGQLAALAASSAER